VTTVKRIRKDAGIEYVFITLNKLAEVSLLQIRRKAVCSIQ